MRATTLLAALVTISTGFTPQSASQYPVPPKGLPEADEVALAQSAAPEEISGAADVYALRGDRYVKVRSGTNGCACLVVRDLHGGSLYPECFDQEGVGTKMQREMMEVTLRVQGRSEADVKRAVAQALASGTLRMASRPAVTYMMSPRQVLFSSPDSSGRRVGAWWPHVMLMLPGLKPDQIGLATQSKVDFLQVSAEGDGHSELVVKVPTWSDGTPVAPRSRPR